MFSYNLSYFFLVDIVNFVFTLFLKTIFFSLIDFLGVGAWLLGKCGKEVPIYVFAAPLPPLPSLYFPNQNLNI